MLETALAEEQAGRAVPETSINADSETYERDRTRGPSEAPLMLPFNS